MPAARSVRRSRQGFESIPLARSELCVAHFAEWLAWGKPEYKKSGALVVEFLLVISQSSLLI